MLTTTRRAVQYPNPDRSDRSDITLHMSYLAAALDVDTLYLQGTDAARSAHAHQSGGGLFWWTTDTGKLWYDDGTTWRDLSAIIASGTVTNAMVNAAAAIAYSKLNLAGSIVNADVASGAAIAYAKLNLAGSVVNADIASGAAIGIAKLAGYPADATKVLKGDASWGVLTKAAGGGALGTYQLNSDSYSGAGQGGMLGMGLAITPSSTGKVVVNLHSTLLGGWVNVGATLQWAYGTGGAPANAAAVTGTVAGGLVYVGTGGNEEKRHVGHCVYVSGLTPGTAYWFDLRMVFTNDPQDGQTPGISDGSYTINEVG